ncbi:MAG TPA: glycosyltransferase family 4 protein [Opitutaceae bacterium]|nr:glycosyltransferase family 4 protein [Opitutaceae bacterium]
MKIIFLTPGTGSYYCGACMRDNTLARELLRDGHDVTMAPMYLPLMLDDAALEGLEATPIFFGGINVYLQQKLAFFRKTPAVLDRLLNRKGLLRWAARHSHMTSAREHGEMTLEMLHVEKSRFRKEWDKLLAWLDLEKPDLVCLSNALLGGFAAVLKQRLGVPVITFFQGEDSFLDGLPEPYRAQCWSALAARLPASDALIAPSRFYADFMRERLGFGAGAIDVVHNGIRLDGYAVAPAPPQPPAIGFFARLCRDKGLEIFVDAFLALARDFGDTTTRLKIAGAATAGDQPFIDEMKRRIASAGLEARVDWSPNVTRDQKIAFLRGLSVFSVPTIYAEAFGMYVLEAMACGIPVVQPQSAAFPEIVGETGGGLCVRPRDPHALASAWQQMLAQPARRAEFGRAGRLGVEKHFSARTMCDQFTQLTARLTRAAQPSHSPS